MSNRVFMDPAIDIVGDDARHNAFLQHIQGLASKLATPTDAFDLPLGLDDDFPTSPRSLLARGGRSQIITEVTMLVLLPAPAPARSIPR